MQSKAKYKYENEIFDQILSTFKFIDPTSQVDTSNWQTYRNEEFGFEFKYPHKWETEPVTFESPGENIFSVFFFGHGEPGDVMVTVYLNKDNLNINEWFDKVLRGKERFTTNFPADNTIRYDSERNVTISYDNDSVYPVVISALEVSDTVFGNITKRLFFTTKNDDVRLDGDHVIEIRVSYTEYTYPPPEEAFNQILSTFEFID